MRKFNKVNKNIINKIEVVDNTIYIGDDSFRVEELFNFSKGVLLQIRKCSTNVLINTAIEQIIDDRKNEIY